MKQEEKQNYGKITIETDGNITELDIIEFVQAEYTVHRVITVATIEDNTIMLSFENPPSKGRSVLQNVRLTEESLICMFSTISIYYNIKGIDLLELLKKSVDKKDIHYTVSNNLKKIEINNL